MCVLRDVGKPGWGTGDEHTSRQPDSGCKLSGLRYLAEGLREELMRVKDTVYSAELDDFVYVSRCAQVTKLMCCY